MVGKGKRNLYRFGDFFDATGKERKKARSRQREWFSIRLHEAAALLLFFGGRRRVLPGLEGILLFLFGAAVAAAKSAPQGNRQNQTEQAEPAHEELLR